MVLLARRKFNIMVHPVQSASYMQPSGRIETHAFGHCALRKGGYRYSRPFSTILKPA